MSGSGLGSHGFTGSWGVALPVPVQEDESLSLQVLGASSLAFGCETWTLTRDPRQRLCVQRAVAARDSNKISYLHGP